MKFKLDENFGTRTPQIFRQQGHEVHTVLEEHLSGTKDSQLYQICVQEQRCLGLELTPSVLVIVSFTGLKKCGQWPYS